MPSIIGVALTQAGKFLGFVDKRGKIRKGRVRKIKNPSGYHRVRGLSKVKQLTSRLYKKGISYSVTNVGNGVYMVKTHGKMR